MQAYQFGRWKDDKGKIFKNNIQPVETITNIERR